MFTLAVIFGGPSPERGISLNSARCVLDHLNSSNLSVTTFFCDQLLRFYRLPTHFLYSNTPADFDFKLHHVAQQLTPDELIASLRSCDLTMPLIHGHYGEDGQLQHFLEQNAIAYVGSSSAVCAKIYHKDRAVAALQALGFATVPSLAIHSTAALEEKINTFATQFPGRLVLKPCSGGSSIDVHIGTDSSHTQQLAIELLGRHSSILIQQYQSGPELTIIVLAAADGQIHALLPTETEMLGDTPGIFSYRAKYLPSTQTRHYTPARLSAADIKTIRNQATEAFQQLNIADIVRFDGYYCPERGLIINDINPMSGMEENSFLFKQAATCGLSHHALLHYLLQNSCARQNIPAPIAKNLSSMAVKNKVFVILGGDNSERQVSLLSGRNVWLKLQQCTDIQVEVFFLSANRTCWKLPYSILLHHTCEEIIDDIAHHANLCPDLRAQQTALSRTLTATANSVKVQSYSLDEFITMAKTQSALIFIALHGGFGEDGRLQKILEQHQVAFTGSGSQCSALCMDKYATKQKLASFHYPWLTTSIQQLWSPHSQPLPTSAAVKQFWLSLPPAIEPKQGYIIKPRQDGCSSGVVQIRSADCLQRYVEFVNHAVATIPANSFQNQPQCIAMPQHCECFIIEPFCATDVIQIQQQQLSHQQVSGWIELTITVLEHLGSPGFFALPPSLTVADTGVLSVEEKFQGGTGINLTPPPTHLLSDEARAELQQAVCTIATDLGIHAYARIDIFYHLPTAKFEVIEVNTLPALTPSTVLFQQAQAATVAMSPRELLIYLTDLARNKHCNLQPELS